MASKDGLLNLIKIWYWVTLPRWNIYLHLQKRILTLSGSAKFIDLFVFLQLKANNQQIKMFSPFSFNVLINWATFSFNALNWTKFILQINFKSINMNNLFSFEFQVNMLWEISCKSYRLATSKMSVLPTTLSPPFWLRSMKSSKNIRNSQGKFSKLNYSV